MADKHRSQTQKPVTLRGIDYYIKLKDNEQLCFLHIPKTAGTTIENILADLLGSRNVLVVPWTKFASESPVNLNAYKVIAGHFYYEIYKLLEKTPLFMTFLRDPIERSISQYYQSLGTRGGHPFLLPNPAPKHEQLQDQNMSIDEYMEDANLNRNILNLQTTMLGWQTEFPIKNLRELMRPMDRSGQVSVNLAKKRLDSMAFVGITERMRESINLFTYTFRLAPVLSVPALNTTSSRLRKTELAPQQLNKLRQLNRLDLDFYEYAQMLFDFRYDQMIQYLYNEYGDVVRSLPVEEMLTIDYWRSFVERNGKFSCQIRYDFLAPFPRAGWHPLEEADGEHWVWSGPENVSFVDLPLDRTSELQVRFRVRYCVSSDVLESLKLLVDGLEVSLDFIKDGDGETIYQGMLPRSKKGNQLNASRLSFCVNHTSYPVNTKPNTPGIRLLGVALSWIEIKPG